jgi:hypothetical protein
VTLAALPWPGGDLEPAVSALRAGDVRTCARALDATYGIVEDDALFAWWSALLERVESRYPSPTS